MFRLSYLPPLLICCWLLVISAWSKPPELVPIQGRWICDAPLIKELHIEATSLGWQISAQGMLDGHPIDWGTSMVRRTSQVSEASHGGRIEPIEVSLFAPNGQIDLLLRPVDEYLTVEAYATIMSMAGPQETQHEWIFTRSAAQGVDTSLHANPLVASAHSGSIHGQAIGPAQAMASLFQVSLYGPDEASRFHSTQSLHEGFSFEHLRDGTYWLFVEPRGSTGVEATPDRNLLRIEQGRMIELPIELR
jgi:hypothetical protein